jgi:hypothetical protein
MGAPFDNVPTARKTMHVFENSRSNDIFATLI